MMRPGAWQPEFDSLLGTAPDKVLAAALGVDTSTIRYHRKIGGVALFAAPRDVVRPLAERFWARVFKGVGEQGVGDRGCWIWIGGLNRFGYGVLWTDGKAVSAHRLSLEMATGPLAEFHALHHCDNPPCVNPAHLYRGTHADNMADTVRHGRHSKGGWREELLGRRFGSLTVTAEADREGTCPRWLAKCECGNEYVLPAHKLKAQLYCCGRRRARSASTTDFFRWCAGGVA